MLQDAFEDQSCVRDRERIVLSYVTGDKCTSNCLQIHHQPQQHADVGGVHTILAVDISCNLNGEIPVSPKGTVMPVATAESSCAALPSASNTVGVMFSRHVKLSREPLA